MKRFLLIAAVAFGCAKTEPPATPPPAPVTAPRPPVATVVDAGTDAAVDAQPDGGAVPVRHAARKPAPPAPGSSSGGVKVEGKLPKADVEKIVRAGMPKLRSCYTAARATNPDLKGRVVFKLTVDHRGSVALGEVVTSTLGGGDPEMCMVRAAQDLRFAKSDGESTVGFQMVFK